MNYFTNTLFLIIYITFCCVFSSNSQSLTPLLFHDSIQKTEIQLLDVRTSSEFNNGHLKGAFQADWTNFEQFKERVASLDKNKTLYVYCLAGSRSASAQEWLLNQGFKNVINLKGGINAWNLEDLPVEHKAVVDQIKLADFLSSLPPNKTVLVDIGAEWCPPCRKMIPIIESLEKDGVLIIQIDGGTQTQLVKELHADTFPTFISFTNGMESKRLSGVCSKEDLLKIISQ
jgi:rhodanese-related sulfurtransferase